MTDTRDKLLDTAERLFSEQGFDATSLRQIISEAGVNLAAIHYHFGSKQELLDAVVMRKATPVNEQRLGLLEETERQAGAAPPPLEKVLEAFLLPMARAADEHPRFVRVMGRIQAEGMLLPVLQRNFQPVLLRFQQSLRRALPGLPEDEFLWGLHFMIGAMAHTMCGAPDFTHIAERCGFGERIDYLIRFVSGGLRALAAVNAPTEVAQ